MDIPISLVYEDVLSEAAMERILAFASSSTPHRFIIGRRRNGNGSGYIKINLRAFCEAARVNAYFILTDLDREECAALLKEKWAPNGVPANLFFRIAVHEVESWLIADIEGLQDYLSISKTVTVADSDSILNPKEFLINMTRHYSKKRAYREGIVPKEGSSIGPRYNELLCAFIRSNWNVGSAMMRSESLSRCVTRLNEYMMTF